MGSKKPPTEIQPATATGVQRTENVSVNISDSDLRLGVHLSMNPVYADAMKEVARYTHAVPAEEGTKQAIQVSRRHYASWMGVLLFGGAAFYAATLHLLTDPLAAVIVGLVAIFKAPEIIKALKEKKSE